jgi:hypothetical protein
VKSWLVEPIIACGKSLSEGSETPAEMQWLRHDGPLGLGRQALSLAARRRNPYLGAMEAKRGIANGVRFAYLEEGGGPLVLLLHGFPDTAHSWDGVRPALAAAG